MCGDLYLFYVFCYVDTPLSVVSQQSINNIVI